MTEDSSAMVIPPLTNTASQHRHLFANHSHAYFEQATQMTDLTLRRDKTFY